VDREGPVDASSETERLSPAPPIAEGGAFRRLVRLASIDVGPLRRHRDFRLLFTGQALSFFGSEVTYVAIPYQAFQLTHSSLVVGLISFAEFVPLLVTPFLGGVLSDAFDRRRLLQLAEAGTCLTVGVLLVNSLLPHPRLWLLFVVVPLEAAVYGIQRPALDALVPRLVPRDELPAASALEGFRGTLGAVAGPAVAGVVIAAAGLPAAYGLDLATFAASLGTLGLMRAVPPPEEAARPSLGSLLEGVRYAKSRQELLGTYGVDIIAMFFGMPMALFPAIAERFGGAGVLGLLYAAPAFGSLLATVTSGWVKYVWRHGMAIILAAATWGVAIVGFGLAPNLPLALAALVVAGGADMVSGIFRMTIWNQTIPDRLRGRLAGIEQVSYTSGPLLGNLEAGVVASLASVRVSVVSGGIFCVVGVALAAIALPAFRHYDARAPQSASPPHGVL
jgi:MFS family permease